MIVIALMALINSNGQTGIMLNETSLVIDVEISCVAAGASKLISTAQTIKNTDGSHCDIRMSDPCRGNERHAQKARITPTLVNY